MGRRFLVFLFSLAVVLLVILGVGFSAAHFLVEPYNEGFLKRPFIVKTHVVLGALYLFFGSFQFIPAIRERWIGYHRAAGRLLAAAALVIGGTAIFIGVAIPFSGFPEQIIMTIFGVFFIVSISAAVASVRSGNIPSHREWMIRAYAIGSAVVTMRLIFIPALVLTESSTREQTAFLSILSFTIAFILHAVIAEWWIRFTREPVAEPAG